MKQGDHKVETLSLDEGKVEVYCTTCDYRYEATDKLFVPAIIERHQLHTRKEHPSRNG